jgi:prepilin-type processing-associated H-X9-DG protein
MAVKPKPSAYKTPWVEPGGKFLAWLSKPDPPNGVLRYYLGSYGLNEWVIPAREPRYTPGTVPCFWGNCLVEGASNVPVLLDSAVNGWLLFGPTEPPEYEDAPWRPMSYFCINRHDGFVNCLFMDWSVRKVGLKELWTLKWHREYDTRNCWTKGAGVKPKDWPQWMRRFKDY